MKAFSTPRLSLLIVLMTAGFFTPVNARADSDYELIDLDHFDFDSTFESKRQEATGWELSVGGDYEILSGPNYDGIDYSNGSAVEGGLYYQVHRFCQVGLEGGYSFGHTTQNVLFTYEGIDLLIEQRLLVSRITPVVRLGEWLDGPWKRRWRPYVQAGAGWYELYEDESFKVSANQFLFRDQLQNKTNDYFGVNGGIGIEAEVYPQGVIGLFATYHHVFSNPQNLSFITPGVRFSYLF